MVFHVYIMASASGVLYIGVTVGGESGNGARPMHKDWVVSLRDQCRKSRVRFFFKQWGGVRKKTTGRKLEGKTYDEFPARTQSPVIAPDARASVIKAIESQYLAASFLPIEAIR